MCFSHRGQGANVNRIQGVLGSCRTPKMSCSHHALLTGAGDWGPSGLLSFPGGRPLGVGAPWCRDDGPGGPLPRGRHRPREKAVLISGMTLCRRAHHRFWQFRASPQAEDSIGVIATLSDHDTTYKQIYVHVYNPINLSIFIRFCFLHPVRVPRVQTGPQTNLFCPTAEAADAAPLTGPFCP